MSEFDRGDAATLVSYLGLSYDATGFDVVSGRSHWYCDVKKVVGHGKDLQNMAGLIVRVASQELGITYNVVGGPTMGAEALSHGTAVMTTKSLDTTCGGFQYAKKWMRR